MYFIMHFENNELHPIWNLDECTPDFYVKLFKTKKRAKTYAENIKLTNYQIFKWKDDNQG